ncbi:hypothetical protein [Nonomuraea rosea]
MLSVRRAVMVRLALPVPWAIMPPPVLSVRRAVVVRPGAGAR